MCFKEHTTLVLNGERLGKELLLQKSQKNSTNPDIIDWEKNFWLFISEWLDNERNIKVQTSGSTGTPKLILLDKERMINSARATGKYFGLNQLDTALLCLPCDYIAGKMMVVRAFVLGLDLILTSPKKPMKDLTEEIQFAAMVPLQVENLMKNNPLSFFNIKQLIIGGAPINNELGKKIKKITTQCYATYGMTETITHIAVKELNGNKASDIYHILPNIEISIDGRGCLIIDAPNLNAEKVITNDIVELLSAKTFKWLGRFDNVINSGGVKIIPEIIETKLNDLLPFRFFIGKLPNEKLGEEVILVVEQEVFDVEYWSERIKRVLNKFEQPKKIFSTSKFLETETGKIKRAATLDLITNRFL